MPQPQVQRSGDGITDGIECFDLMQDVLNESRCNGGKILIQTRIKQQQIYSLSNKGHPTDQNNFKAVRFQKLVKNLEKKSNE